MSDYRKRAAWTGTKQWDARRKRHSPSKHIRRAANRKALQAALVAAAQDYAERGYKPRSTPQKPLTDVFQRVVPVDCRPEQVEAA